MNSNTVMEIDATPNVRNNYIDSNVKDSQVNLDIDLEQNDILVPTDLKVLSTDFELDLDPLKTEISISIGEGGKGGKVYTDQVYFKDDVLAAGEYTQVGNLVKSKEESVELPMKGKTLADFIRLIFTKELQPKKTEPSVTVSFPQSGSYEVGSEVTPSYSASFSPGSYTYGPPTGVTVESWSVKDSSGGSSSKSSGTFNSFTVTDSSSYSISATAKHTEGAIALSNLGNESLPIVKIEAGTKSRTSAAVTGYRSYFYGAVDTDDSTILTSTIIRSLTNGGNYNGQKSFVIKANSVSNPKRIIVAIPGNTTRVGVSKVLLTSAFDTDITAQYVKQATKINVEGKNGYVSIPYTIYQYEPAKIDEGEIHTVTLG